MGGVLFIFVCGFVGVLFFFFFSGFGNGVSQNPDSFVFSVDISEFWSVLDVQLGDSNIVFQWDDLDEICGYGSVYGIVCSKFFQMFVNDVMIILDTKDCDGNLLYVEV